MFILSSHHFAGAGLRGSGGAKLGRAARARGADDGGHLSRLMVGRHGLRESESTDLGSSRPQIHGSEDLSLLPSPASTMRLGARMSTPAYNL